MAVRSPVRLCYPTADLVDQEYCPGSVHRELQKMLSRYPVGHLPFVRGHMYIVRSTIGEI